MVLSDKTLNALLAILNIFVRPAETVRLTKGNKLAWFWPIVLGGFALGVYNHTLPRATMQALRNEPPAGMDAAKLDALVGNMEVLSRFTTISSPMLYAVMILLGAVLTFAMCVILQANVRFPDLYNFMAHVGLINSLQTLCLVAVLRGKGPGIGPKDLTPSFGLDVFLAEDVSKFVRGVAGFFTVFTVWHIVVLVVGFAALTGVSKGRAFLATAPSWLVGLLYAVVVTMSR